MSDGKSGVGVQGAGAPADTAKESLVTRAIDGGEVSAAHASQDKEAEVVTECKILFLFPPNHLFTGQTATDRQTD